MKTLTTVLAVTLLTISPALPILSFDESGAAFANNGNGGGNGNGGNGNGGNGNGGNGGNGKSESKSAKSEKSEKSVAKSETKKKKAKLDGAGIEVVKGKAPAEGELAPNELGKMNGALNANMNAVLAHIRNGQTTNGPVGLLAGLAIADAEAAEALTVAGELSAIAVAFDALSSGLTEAGFGSVEDYLQAKADGTLTEDQVALVDPLIDAVGGTAQDGLALAETPPTAEEILAAEAAAEAARQGVTDAETAIGDAWNKEGDLATLLSLLRDKLAGNQAEIDAAIKETNGQEDLAAVTPVDAEVVN
jgi:hypothetical protein